MKRQVLITLFMLSMAMAATAGNYVVYYVKGEVKCTQGRATFVLKERNTVTDKDVFSLPSGAVLILKDEANHRLPVVKGPCQGKLNKLVKQGNGSILERTAEFFAQLVGKSHSDMKEITDHMRARGSVERRQTADGHTLHRVEKVPVMPEDLTPEEGRIFETYLGMEQLISELENEP